MCLVVVGVPFQRFFRVMQGITGIGEKREIREKMGEEDKRRKEGREAVRGGSKEGREKIERRREEGISRNPERTSNLLVVRQTHVTGSSVAVQNSHKLNKKRRSERDSVSNVTERRKSTEGRSKEGKRKEKK